MAAMITDSHRTDRRSCRRVIPTARSIPISCVRSWTDSASVFTMPSTAMASERKRSATRTPRNWSMSSASASRDSARVSTSRLGKSLRSSSATAAFAAVTETPGATLA